jgi:hypothetical protein
MAWGAVEKASTKVTLTRRSIAFENPFPFRRRGRDALGTAGKMPALLTLVLAENNHIGLGRPPASFLRQLCLLRTPSFFLKTKRLYEIPITPALVRQLLCNITNHSSIFRVQDNVEYGRKG